MTLYTRYKNVLAKVSKPCAFIDVDALNDNIKKIDAQANGKSIRIASKSIRSVAIIEHILQTSHSCKGLMCFTGEEAIYLYNQGLDDLLIAYPIWDEKVLRDICRYTKNGAAIFVMIDSVEHVKRLERIASEEAGYFRLCMDIDMSTKFPMLHFGVYRSPLRTLNQVKKLSLFIQQQQHVQVEAVMGYEAQIAGLTDANPYTKFKNIAIRSLKANSIKKLRHKRKELVEFLVDQHPTISIVNGGGTGSLHLTSTEDIVTEVTVGSGFYASHLFDKYKDFSYKPATGFAIEITRIPEKNIYTCYGGGYVASGALGKDKLPEVYLPKSATLTVNEGVGEVQTPIQYDGKHKLTYGDPIFLRHSKAGEICERFNEIHLIQKDSIVETVTTYRGDGKCFL